MIENDKTIYIFMHSYNNNNNNIKIITKTSKTNYWKWINKQGGRDKQRFEGKTDKNQNKNI